MKRASNTIAKKPEDKKPSFITKKATEDIEVSIYPPQDGASSTSASLKVVTAAGDIYIKGHARWSTKNDNWFFSAPSHKTNDGYVQDVFGEKNVFESINNTINAIMEVL